jgi:hypothetical protein
VAWRFLTLQQADPENEAGSIKLQRRIAASIIAIASSGVIDPARMAKATILSYAKINQDISSQFGLRATF